MSTADPVKERMEKATHMKLNKCATCSGHIKIDDDDLKEESDRDTEEARFKEIVQLASQGAASACGGCQVSVSSTWNKESKTGTISATGVDPAHHNPGGGGIII